MLEAEARKGRAGAQTSVHKVKGSQPCTMDLLTVSKCISSAYTLSMNSDVHYKGLYISDY